MLRISGYYKGLYFLSIGMTSEAEYYFRKELAEGNDLNNQTAACRGLYYLYKSIAHRDSMAKYADISYCLNDSSTKLLETSKLLQMQSLYNYEHSQKVAREKEIEADRAKVYIMVLAFMLIFIIVITLFVLYAYREKWKRDYRQYKENVSKLNELHTIIASMEHDEESRRNLVETMRVEMAMLKRSIAEYEKQNQNRAIAFREETLRNEKIVLRFRTMLNPPFEAPSSSDWMELRQLFNAVLPTFYGRLNTDKYILTELEYQVSMLIRLHFTPSEIAILCQKDISYVSKIRCRLLKKVFGKEGSAKQYDEMLFIP